MSKYSLNYWNGSEAGDRVLVGHVERDGNPWWYRSDLQGVESNIYSGPVPVGDVMRRLFNWEPLSTPLYAAIPCGIGEADTIGPDGQPVRFVVAEDRQAIVASDTNEVLGVFKSGYVAHPYSEWLLGNVANLLGGEVAIGSAGFPVRSRAQAWVQIRTPERVKTPQGVEFLPHLLACTSLDGSLATIYKNCATVTVCDNTFSASLAEGSAAQRIKIKHTKYSNLRINDAQAVLGLIGNIADSFAEQIADLCAWTITDRQFDLLLDKMVEAGESQRSKTMADNKRAAIKSLYRHDERASTWKGTAFGVLQAFDTYERHMAIVRGASRPERQMSGTIDGTFDALDKRVLAALATV